MGGGRSKPPPPTGALLSSQSWPSTGGCSCGGRGQLNVHPESRRLLKAKWDFKALLSRVCVTEKQSASLPPRFSQSGNPR